MSTDRINELIKKYINNSASKSEEDELLEWYRAKAYKDSKFPMDKQEVYGAMLEKINDAMKTKHRFNYKTWAVAASVVMITGFGVAIYKAGIKSETPKEARVQNKIQPGGNRAILTLANGKKISLVNTANGRIAIQGGVEVTKSVSSQLIYSSQSSDLKRESSASKGEEIAYNTIEIPAGGQYQVILPDHSKVWLNSLSQLKFPVSFKNLKERRVELTGEGYFEVVHNEKQPFRVSACNTLTEDIGTTFNIKAYKDDPDLKLTLITGAASITAGGGYAVLKPGKQAMYNKDLTVSSVNFEDEIAWKNGYFRFSDENLENIMKSLARWYNIKYIFQDKSLKNETYAAVTDRFANITPLLNLMEKTGNAEFKIIGNTVMISKKK